MMLSKLMMLQGDIRSIVDDIANGTVLWRDVGAFGRRQD